MIGGAMSDTSTNTGASAKAPNPSKQPRRPIAAVIPFDPVERHAPPTRRQREPEPEPRAIYSVPGFLTAARRAQERRPDLTRAAVVAVACDRTRAGYFTEESFIAFADAHAVAARKVARGHR